jgi:DNA-binding transcriptional regulator GbsR (MarR family)
MSEKTISPELEELAERIGEFIQYWGFKRVHGKIWTHLFLCDRPVDAQELIRRLKVSKALMSFSLNDLLKYEVIMEVGKSERNTQLYQINPDTLNVILNVIRRREKRLLSQIGSANNLLTGLPDEQKVNQCICPDRLKSLTSMIDQAQSTLNAMLSLEAIDFKAWGEILKSQNHR